jgi:hypothetical protein
MDRDWKRFESLANHNIMEPPEDPPPPCDILDILSWTTIVIFVVGLLKRI